MQGLSLPQLLLLLSLLLLSRTQAQTLNCFICSSETSPNCEDALSPSDTSLIKPCSRGKDNLVAPLGCQILMIRTRPYDLPKQRIFWRDCLYPSDFSTRNLTVPQKGTRWQSGRYIYDCWEHYLYRHPTCITHSWLTLHPEVNRARSALGLPTMAWNNILNYTTYLEFQYYVHPQSQHWNVSNGAPAKTLFLDYYKVPVMQSVKCFVCTNEDPGCEASLTPSSSPAFIKDCIGSVSTTVPIGCQVLIGQYEYPILETYFYRDCFYENYLLSHNQKYEDKITNEGINWFGAHKQSWRETEGFMFSIIERLDIMNRVRKYLGLYQISVGSLPYDHARPVTALYFLPGEPAPGRGHEHLLKYLNQSNLSNGEAIPSMISKQPVPKEFKINGTFSCVSCDSSTGDCGGEKGEATDNLPQQQCKTPNDDAYGCMMIWAEGPPEDQLKTLWMRRGCWYKGDMNCIKLDPPRQLSSRRDPICNNTGNCDGRYLVKEGKTVYWEGGLYNAWWNKRRHDHIRTCMKSIRQRLGVTESLPEIPEHEDIAPEDREINQIRYAFKFVFCAGRNLCNDKKGKNILPPTTTTTSTAPPPTTSTTPDPGGKCKPGDEVDDPDCECEGDCDLKKDEEWLTFVLVGIGVVVTLAVAGAGVWLWLKRRGRIGPGVPVGNDRQGEGNVSQFESKGPVESSEQVGA